MTMSMARNHELERKDSFIRFLCDDVEIQTVSAKMIYINPLDKRLLKVVHLRKLDTEMYVNPPTPHHHCSDIPV
jgi:hypothetical protein